MLDCLCLPLPLQLLLVSKAIHDEVEQLLYGRNKFSVSPFPKKSPGHLEVIFRLSPHAWRSMKSIHIGLTAGERMDGLWHEGEAPDWYPSIEDVRFQCRSSGYMLHTPNDRIFPSHQAIQPHNYLLGEVPPQTLQRENNTSEELIRKWKEVCNLIHSRISASQLHLSISCTTNDKNIARAIVEPLAALPTLRTCAIHFGYPYLERDAFKTIAKKSLLHLHNRKSVTGLHGSFDDLPKEIRLKILSYTNLVYELKRYRSRRGLSVVNGRIQYSERKCCTQCSDALAVCCCWSLRAAAFSTKCDCYKVPLELFSVNRRFYSDAFEVYFSRNRFIFGADNPDDAVDDFDGERQWLDRLPVKAYPWFRTIEVVFGHGLIALMREQGSKASRSWNAFAQTISHLLDVSKVCLTINAGSLHFYWEPEDRNPDWAKPAYNEILKPLKTHLSGLRKLHVLLSWSPEYEAIMEQEVMGSSYDSERDGKRPFSERERKYRPWDPSNIPPY
ncbi:MAG: hypothetical protein Q9191_008136 [Dirinaria sp. TL-2023a]